MLSLLIDVMDSLPEVALLPDQLPDALQLVELTLLQLRVVEPLGATDAGAAANVTSGAARGAPTADACPPLLTS